MNNVNIFACYASNWTLKFITLLFFVYTVPCISCNNAEISEVPLKLIVPEYGNTFLVQTKDTLSFKFGDFVSIRSVNYFSDHENEYLSLYDKKTASLNLYNFCTQKLEKVIPLKEYLPNRRLDQHTTVFVYSLDSVLVISDQTLFLFRNSFSKKDSINLEAPNIRSYSNFGTSTPPIALNNRIYTKATPVLSTSNFSDIRKWKVFFNLDLNSGESKLEYGFPSTYLDSLYGYYFFDPSYCINDQGRIVISFPADSCIYETDLKSFSVRYLAKSRFHNGPLTSLTKFERKDVYEMNKAFLLRNSYKSIYYDKYSKRYIRISEIKLSEREYMLGKKNKKKSAIIMDENFKIISESIINDNGLLSSMIFTKNGKIYTRIRSKDEYTVSFLRMEYNK